MKRPFRLLCVVASACLFAATASTASAEFVIGVFDTSRATTANIATGSLTVKSRESLLTHFPDATYATTPTLTSEFLAGVDTVILSSVADRDTGITPLHFFERRALFDYVEGGGTALLVAEGYGPFLTASLSLLNTFGMAQQDDGRVGWQNAIPYDDKYDHPLVNGPFGSSGGLILDGLAYLHVIGPYATPISRHLGSNFPVLAAIERDAIAPGSGRVVILADSSPFASLWDLPNAENLFLNSIDYLLPVPEPSALVLGGMALVGFVLVGWRRRGRGWLTRGTAAAARKCFN
ncbi:MAG: PEP-CTERM sorting domain-containing protein [Planctomycetota bacterium]|nr:MAG: PEP-CTERM sorting domain-containing protein [Planctomycetota bacterium]